MKFCGNILTVTSHDTLYSLSSSWSRSCFDRYVLIHEEFPSDYSGISGTDKLAQEIDSRLVSLF